MANLKFKYSKNGGKQSELAKLIHSECKKLSKSFSSDEWIKNIEDLRKRNAGELPEWFIREVVESGIFTECSERWSNK